METIYYLIMGLIIGGILGYILSRLTTRKYYVPAETFALLKDQLTRAEKELSSQSQEILGLTNQLTALELNEKHLQDKITGFKEELLIGRHRRDIVESIVADDRRRLTIDDVRTIGEGEGR